MKDLKKETINDDELLSVAGGKIEYVEEKGTVIEILPNACFTVRLDSGEVIKTSISGKLRMNYIRIFVGDRVAVQSSADGGMFPRITFRFKNSD